MCKEKEKIKKKGMKEKSEWKKGMKERANETK